MVQQLAQWSFYLYFEKDVWLSISNLLKNVNNTRVNDNEGLLDFYHIRDEIRREKKVGSVVKKRRKRMAKKKHKKLLKKTRIQRRNKK